MSTAVQVFCHFIVVAQPKLVLKTKHGQLQGRDTDNPTKIWDLEQGPS